MTCIRTIDRQTTRSALVALLVVLTPALFSAAPAAAQSAAAEIRERVRQGQEVVVVDDQGREFKGRIRELAADRLTLASKESPTELAYDSIVRISRPRDGVGNGALAGLAAGAAIGVVAMVVEDVRDCNPEVWFDCSDPGAAAYLVVPAIFGGIGAAIGAGVDALIRREPTLYRRGTRVSIAPAIGPRGAGGRIIVSW